MSTIDPKRSALLVMDMQEELVASLGEAAGPLVDRAATLVTAAREAGMPVLYVVVGFRPGYPELDWQGPMYARVSGRFQTTTPGSDIVDALRPRAEDVIVFKHRVGAFSGTDLDQILRAKRIDTLVLLGISTSGVVLSTVRHAFDADYRLVVVEDACTDRDDEVHRVLMEKVFRGQARVAKAAEIAVELGAV